MMSPIMNKTKKIKNRILAMPAAANAIPPKPRIPAMIAMMRKINAYRSTAMLLYAV
jgi:hypothetical protein